MTSQYTIKVLLILFLSTLFLLAPFNGAQWVLLGLVLTGFLLVRRATIPFIRFDLILAGFVCLMGLSTLWATNIALTWHPIFSWCLMLLVVLSGRYLWREADKELSLCLWVIFGVSLFHQLFAIHYEIPYDQIDWNKFLFKNRNYTTAYIISLYPFLLFASFKSKFARFLKPVAGVMLLSIVLLTKAYGAGLALLLLLLYYFGKTRATNFFSNHISGLASVATLVILGFLVVTVPSLSHSIYLGNMSEQPVLIDLTLKSFGDSWFMGSGIGNWLSEVYQYAEGTSLDGRNRLPSHNLYFTILSELGILGFGLLMVLLFYPLYYVVRRQDLPWYISAAGGTLLVYIICSFFYRDTNSHVQHFSALQLLAFISIGGISSYFPGQRIARGVSIFLTAIALVCSVWFVYERQSFRKGTEVIKMVERSADPDQIINKVNEVYHPVFNTHYGNLISFDALIINQSARAGDNSQSSKAAERLRKIDPHHPIFQE